MKNKLIKSAIISASVILSASFIAGVSYAQHRGSTFEFGEAIEPKKHDVKYDVLGIKVGMTKAEVKEKLLELYDEGNIKENETSFGNHEVQSETFISEISAETRSDGRTTVKFTSPKLGGKVKYVERHIIYPDSKPRPDIEHLNKITAEKYGVVENTHDSGSYKYQYWSSNNCKLEKSKFNNGLPSDCDVAIISEIFFDKKDNGKVIYLNIKLHDIANAKLDGQENRKLFDDALDKHRKNQGETKF